MTQDNPINATTVKGPVARKKKIFSLLGTALLMTCLFAGLAQAADNSNVLKDNGLLVNGITPASGQVFGSAASGDMLYDGDQILDCGAHVVECFDGNHKSVGTIANGACYIHWTFPPECESDDTIDLYHCQDKYGETIQYTKSLSSCQFH